MPGDYRSAEKQHVLATGPSEKKKADVAMTEAPAAFKKIVEQSNNGFTEATKAAHR